MEPRPDWAAIEQDLLNQFVDLEGKEFGNGWYIKSGVAGEKGKPLVFFEMTEEEARATMEKNPSHVEQSDQWNLDACDAPRSAELDATAYGRAAAMADWESVESVKRVAKTLPGWGETVRDPLYREPSGED
jgi:outer membrane receptor for ferric coprogen and ferric-rhodotorulic acid